MPPKIFLYLFKCSCFHVGSSVFARNHHLFSWVKEWKKVNQVSSQDWVHRSGVNISQKAVTFVRNSFVWRECEKKYTMEKFWNNSTINSKYRLFYWPRKTGLLLREQILTIGCYDFHISDFANQHQRVKDKHKVNNMITTK